MNPLTGLTDYLGRVERRLRVLTWSRGAALAAAAALIFTVLGVLLANAFAFSDPSLQWARVLVFVAMALALSIGLVVPLMRLNRRRAARETERKFPAFEERLLTFTERAQANPNDPFLPLLASDTLNVAQQAEPSRVAPQNRMLGFLSAAVGSLAVLIWLGTSGPGFLGYGTALLWGGLPKGDFAPYYDINVQPGNRTVRKRADQIITAQPRGFQAQHVNLLVKYSSSSKWEQAAMRPQLSGSGFEFLIAGVPESLDYYVEAGGVRSKQYRLNVVDLPNITHLKVTYHFPAWTGTKEKVEDPGGDLRAVEGTEAELSIETDRPLPNGALLFDDGTKLLLRAGDNGERLVRVPIRKDGMYHIASIEQGEDVRLSPDYFIEAQHDEPPTVRIVRPMRDARVNPIEEVTVAVEGQDDFGLHEMNLHYSVNGEAEKTVPLLKSQGLRNASGSAVIALEDFKLSPGDLISLYATTRDAHSLARTDMMFIQTEPFERNYTQSQESGGGGAGGEEDNHISDREKEIIAATWNQIKDTSGNKNAATENATFLSGVQSKLRDQAKSLSQRMKARALAGANEEFKRFTDDMDKAVEAMGPATDKLRGSEWQNALTPEQKALQHLLRAEATFRDIKVSMSRGAGGGQPSGGAERDLQSLFDLELDTEKNQYESQQHSAADKKQKEIDEALQKLEQLANRQKELAEQQKQKQVAQQRWQQEMLRREAEELQRKMEQLSRNGSEQQQSSDSSQSSQSQSAQGQSSQRNNGSQSSSQMSHQSGQVSSQQLQKAIEQLRQAQENMRQSTSTQSEADAQRAAERLQQARDSLSGMRQQQNANNVDDLARRAEEMARQQQEYANKLRQAFGAGQQQGQGASQPQAEAMAHEKEQMAQEFQKLESDIGKASRESAASDRRLSSKLRDALGNLQQNELNNRMRWTADALRRGQGSYAVMREAVTTQALNQLRDELREAQQSMAHGQQGISDKDRQGLEQALAQTEKLRKEIESGRQGSGKEQSKGAKGQQSGANQQPGNKGDQSGGKEQAGGQDQSGQQGKEPGGKEGSPNGQPGGQTMAGGQSGPRMNGRQGGQMLPQPGPTWGDAGNAGTVTQEFRETLRQLQGNPQVGKDMRNMIGDLYKLDPRLAVGDPQLMNRIQDQMLAGVEQIELRLRRMLDEQTGGGVRSDATGPVPQGYADAVAEYFRRLSKEK